MNSIAATGAAAAAIVNPAAAAQQMRAGAGRDAAVPPEEAPWLARARAGEAEAQAWLLERYRHRMVRLAAHVLRRPDDAEDAAQEAMVRALQHLHAFRGDSPFSNWLFRITVRTCLELMRKRRRHPEVPLDGAVGDRAAAASSGDDSRLLIASLLDELSPPMRAALTLREIEGLSYEEVAAVLNVPVGTVRSRLNAARARFRELYAAAQKETDDV